jgi:hypothetical protein
MSWETYSLLGIGAGVAALTLTRSTLTQKLRNSWRDKPVIGELINCPYCMCHWTGTLFSLDGSLTPRYWDGYLINACVVTGIAVLFTGIALKLWLFQEAELDRYRQVIKEMNAQLKRVNHEAETD